MLPQELIEGSFDSSQGSAVVATSIYLKVLCEAAFFCKVNKENKYHKIWTKPQFVQLYAKNKCMIQKCVHSIILTSGKAPANEVSWKMVDSQVMKQCYNLDPKSGA